MKHYEIDYNRHVYFLSYEWEGNKLSIADVFTHDEIGNKIDVDSINDSELFQRIYAKVEKETASEKMEQAEYEAQLREDIEIGRGEEKRKGI